jgi:hypothetical protein
MFNCEIDWLRIETLTVNENRMDCDGQYIKNPISQDTKDIDRSVVGISDIKLCNNST